jgi:hypothetical protein
MDLKTLKQISNKKKLLLHKTLKMSQVLQTQQKQKKRSKLKSLSQRNRLRE